MMRTFTQARERLLVSRCAVLLLSLTTLVCWSSASGQSRLNDKDLEAVMKSLRDDAKNFRDPFKNAIHKTAIRNTSQEKDAKNLTSAFATQTDQMWKHFKSTKKADSDLPAVLDSAGRIDRLVYSFNLDQKTTAKWEQ